MLTKLKIQISPKFSDVQKFIDGLIPKLRQFKRPLKKSALLMKKSIGKNFAVGGRPPWQALSDNTIAKKGHSTILVDTGQLKNSFKIPTASDSEAKVTSATPHGHFHQQGGELGNRNARGLIARPFMLFQSEDIKNITKHFVIHIEKKIQFRQTKLLGGFKY